MVRLRLAGCCELGSTSCKWRDNRSWRSSRETTAVRDLSGASHMFCYRMNRSWYNVSYVPMYASVQYIDV
jgi:hypothetical protein